MPRSTDTRQLTRETAERLAAAGQDVQTLTVDAIYAEIRQGSRSTINDELKRWKLDQQRTDGLSTDLPPEAAQAMRELWHSAVTQAEQLFETRRAALLEATEAAQRQQAQAEQSLASANSQLTQLQGERQQLHEQLAAQTQALLAQTTRGQTLEHSLHALQAEAQAQREHTQQQLDAQRQAHEQHLAELRQAQAEQETAWRADMARAAERLEAVQRHVMLQVAEARETQKRAEQQASQHASRSERLGTELEALRLAYATQSAQLTHTQQVLLQAQAEQQRLGLELQQSREQLSAAQDAAVHPLRQRAQRRAERKAQTPPSAPPSSASKHKKSSPKAAS